MRNNFKIGIGILTAFLSMFGNSSYADTRHHVPIRTVTLSVKKYDQLETVLQTAVENKNLNQINTLLAADFEERNGLNPNSPIPKDDWIANEIKSTDHHPLINQMAVRTLNQLNIVSYISHKKNGTSYFIVDVWQQAVLLARYTAKVID